MPTEPTYKERLAGLDTFMFDVDGVFTDNRVLLMPDMDPVRTFHSRDAYAVQLAVREGLRIVIVTGGHSDGVVQSFHRLGVTEVHTRTRDKFVLVQGLIADGRLDPARAAYMGDDIPDLRVMRHVALACCPNDAAEEVKAISHFVSRAPGGAGCVRDLLEQALKVKGLWLTDAAYTW